MKKTNRSLRKWLLILIIEFVILVAASSFVFISNNHYSTGDIPFSSDYISPNDAGLYHVDHLELFDEYKDRNESIPLVSSVPISLPKGDYTLSFKYSSGAVRPVFFSVDENESANIQANTFYISRNKTETTYHFRVLRPVETLRIGVDYDYLGEFTLYGAEIVQNRNDLKRIIVMIVLAELLLNLVILKATWIKKHITETLILAVACILTSLPQVMAFPYGHDLNFHLVRIDSIATELGWGQFPVRMGSLWMDGLGYPASIFYGDIILYIPAVFRMMGFSIVESYTIYLVIQNIATVLIAYFCFRPIAQNEKSAAISAAAYATATYRLVDIYVRSAVGEATVFTFLPFLALGCWRMYSGEKEEGSVAKTRIPSSPLVIAVGMTGVILSHTASVFLIILILLIITLVFWKKTFTRKVMFSCLSAILMTVLFSAFFILPFFDYMVNADIIGSQVGYGNIDESGAYLIQYITVFADPFGFDIPDLSQRMTLTPGVLLMPVLFVGIFMSFRKGTDRSIRFLTLLSCILLWMSSNLFPWYFLSIHVHPIFSSFQFPWRILTMSCLFQSLLLCRLIGDLDVAANRIMFIVACVLLIVAGGFFTIATIRSNEAGLMKWMDTAELNNYNITSYFMRNGYNKFHVTHSDIIKYHGMEQVDGIIDQGLEEYISGVKSSADDESPWIDVARYYYPYWHAYDSFGEELPIKDGPNKLIRIELPAGYSGTLSVRWIEPWLWRVAEMISILSVIFVIFYFGYFRKKTGKE